MIKVLFVCLGNICRSPTAEGVMRHRVLVSGLQDSILVDSAGTGDWHIGRTPDSRACDAARLRGYDLSGLRARQVKKPDLSTFDHIFAMDRDNLRDLLALAEPGQHEKIKLLLGFVPKLGQSDVPDPYYGGEDGFARVLDLVESACDALLADLVKRHSLKSSCV